MKDKTTAFVFSQHNALFAGHTGLTVSYDSVVDFTSFPLFPLLLRALIPRTAELMAMQSSRTDRTISTAMMLRISIWWDTKTVLTLNSH